MTTPIIALSGYARSGKDSAARALIAQGWEHRAFADVLRAFLLAVDPLVPVSGWRRWLPWGPRVERLSALIARVGWGGYKEVPGAGDEVRALLQRLGTDAGRALLGEDVWVDATLNRPVTGEGLVLTDCRFPNEAEAVRERGGAVVRVERPGVGPVNSHISETALDDYDGFAARLANDGTLADLDAQVLAARRWVLERAGTPRR